MEPSIFDSAKEEGELSDDEEDISDEGIYHVYRHNKRHTHPMTSKFDFESNRSHTNHHHNVHKQETAHYQSQAYPAYDIRKRGRTRQPPKRLSPKRASHSSQENNPTNLKPSQTTATNSCKTTTHVQASGITSYLSSRENVAVPSLLTLEIPVPSSFFLQSNIPPPPPPPPPPLPDAPPPDKPEPPPLSLPAVPRERARKQKSGSNNVPVQSRMKSPPAGDVEDPDYIDLLLEYQCIKKQLDKLSKVEESKKKKAATPHRCETGQGDGSAVQTIEIHQERDDEDLDILQLRLNALKSVGSDSPVNSPVKSTNQGVSTNRDVSTDSAASITRGSPTKRSLPFAPRDIKFQHTPEPANQRRRNNSSLRVGSSKSYRDVPRRGRDISWRDESLVRRWGQERKREQAEQRRRDEEKRRAEQRRLEDEYETNRRRLEVQKIVTLDDPKEQYKRFMELVAGVEKVTRSEVKDTKPTALADNYEEVAMELDSDGTPSTDDKVAMTTDVFNLPKLEPNVIPGLDLSISSTMHEPAFTADLVAFGPAANAFHKSFDSPSFADLYVSPSKSIVRLSPIHMADLPSTESDLPESSEEIPGLGWSNEPRRPRTPEETTVESSDVRPEMDADNLQQEEDEEALLRAKLLKSLLMRKKLQADTSSREEPQTNDSSSPAHVAQPPVHVAQPPVHAVKQSIHVVKQSDDVVKQSVRAVKQSDDVVKQSVHAVKQADDVVKQLPSPECTPGQHTCPETLLPDKQFSGSVKLYSPQRADGQRRVHKTSRQAGRMDRDIVQKTSRQAREMDQDISNDVPCDTTDRESVTESESKVYRKVPRHGPVVIRIGDESDESADEQVVTIASKGPSVQGAGGSQDVTVTSKVPSLQGSGGGRVNALLGNLDSFIKEARMSVEANVKAVQENRNKVDVDDDKLNSEMVTPEVMKNMPRTKIAEYKKLKEQLLKGKRTGSSSNLSKMQSPSEVQEDQTDKLARQKEELQKELRQRVVLQEEELQKELRQRVVLLQLELVQQRHSLRVNNDTYSSLKHEITKKRAVLKMGEDHIQKLREQLAANERIVQSNRNQLNILNEQAQDSQALVDERMARVQALEAQLVSVGRQAYGESFTPKMADQALMMDPLGQGKKKLTVTVNKNHVPGRQVKLPIPTSLPDTKSTLSPARKVVVVKKKPVVLSKPAAARKVKLNMKNAKLPKRIPNVTKPATTNLRTSRDISAEKARLMKLEQKLAAMIQKHKAVHSTSKANLPKAKKPMPAPELPWPGSNVWKSIRRRSGSHVRRDSEPEHIKTEELMKVDHREENMPPTNVDKNDSSLDTSQSTKPSLFSNHGNPKCQQAQCDKHSQGANKPAHSKILQDIYKVNSVNDFNKIVKAYRTSLQQRFKESVTAGGRHPPDTLLTPLTQLPAPEQNTQDKSRELTAAGVSCVCSQLDDDDEEGCGSLKDYRSPLLHLRGYRLSSYFRTKEKLSLVSSSHSHKINPYKPFCPYELMGKCNDDKCVGQHASHYKLSHDELLKDYISYHSPMVTDNKAKLQEELNTFVDQFTKTHNSKFSVDQQCLLLVAKVNKMSQRAVPHTMMTDVRQWRPRQKAEKDLPAEEVSGSKSAASRTHHPDDMILTDRDTRYWVGGATSVPDMEAAVLEKPTDIDMWLRLAYHKLHNLPGRREDRLDLALNVLARSLEANSKNSQVWLHYLSLYSRRVDATDIESLYKQGLSYAPSYQLYWKYLMWCGTMRDKFDVCHQIMKFLLSELCTETPGEKSHHLLEILIHQVSLYVNIGLEQEGLQLIQCAIEVPSSGPAPEPWHILTHSDRLLLILTHIHLQLFHRVPHQLYGPSGIYPGRIVTKVVFSLPWPQLFQGLNVNDSVSAPQVFKLCKEAHTILQYWITQIQSAVEQGADQNQDERFKNLNVLHNNLADMYLAAGRPRSALTCCGESLASDVRHKEAYIKLIECAARNKDERSAGARCWYKQAIVHLPTCAKIYLTAADYELQQGEEDAALELMEQCALAMFVTDSANSASCDPNLLLCKLLEQPVPLDFDAPPLRPSVTPADIEVQKADFWNCYCLLLELQGCLDQAIEVYETAVLTLRDTDGLVDVWKRYLRHKHKALLSSAVTNQGEAFRQYSSLVSKCLSTLPNRVAIPYTSNLTWLSYRPHNSILELYIQTVPPELMVDVYERLLRTMPDNIPLLLRVLNYLQKNGHVALAKGYCVSALVDRPRCLALWNIYISLLQKENNVTEMRRAYKQATDALPLNANLWKDFVQFELIQGSEERLQEVLDLSKDPDLHLDDWVQTWTGTKVKVAVGKKQTTPTCNSKKVKGKFPGTIQKSPKSIQRAPTRKRIEPPAKAIGVIHSNVDRKSKDQAKIERKLRK